MKLIIEPENETKIAEWLASRGGVAVWVNCDLSSSRIGNETLTPATHADGTPATSPHWSNGNSPARIVTDPADVGVREWTIVSRVKVRRGPPCYGFFNRQDKPRLDAALAKAGDGASWTPDYSNMKYGSAWFDAVISVPGEIRPLAMPALSPA
jgi:hypothetical protein